ncbi:MAG: DUF6056 family protein [Kofleriaceae bacterium]
MTIRNERVVFVAAVVAMWTFFFVQALHTPTLLDDWYQLTWHRHHAFGLQSIWEYGHYNYFHFNPRIGDVELMIVNGPRWIHLVVTPLVQMALLPLAYAVAFGRWPRATLRDLGLLMVLQTAIWLITPIPGIVYFYRPFTTNYLWSIATMLALFAPYRLDDGTKSRPWLAPIMLVVGWCAGMGNEHTGPTAMLAMACLLVWKWRQGQLRLWMLAGALGLYIGYPMLFLAPGQHLRYAGMATKNSPVKLLVERGVTGTGGIVMDFVAETQFAVDLVVLAMLAMTRGKVLGAFGTARTWAMIGLIVAAGGMVCTQWASPTVGERLFLAPAVLFASALVLVIDWLWTDRFARTCVVIVAGALFAFHVVKMVDTYADGYAENQRRMDQLAAAPSNTKVVIAPYALWKRSRWWWGDDLQYASLREYVANEVYDLNGIEYDRPLHWVEPSPTDHFVATRTFEPPLTPEDDAKVAPRYVPTFWEWALVQLRRSLVLGPIADVRDHKLVHYTVDVAESGLVDPHGRPTRVLDWTPTKLTFVDGRQFDDRDGRPWIRVWSESVPAETEDAYIVGCGKTTRVMAQPDPDEHIGPMLPVALDCRGTFSAYLCDPKVCWLAGRYWR